MQHLAATFSLLFAALSESFATATATDNDRCTKIAGNISSLAQNCAAEIVKTGFFQEFFQQVEHHAGNTKTDGHPYTSLFFHRLSL